MKSIPVIYTETIDWLNRGLMHHPANDEFGDVWLGADLSQEVLCHHHGELVSYYTDDLVSMYSVCQDCGERVAEAA